MANIKDLGIDQLVGLYVKTLKDCKVYSSIWGSKPTEWTGWTYKAGQNVGQLWSWIDGSNTTGFVSGLWMMFKTASGQYYYIKVEKKLIDWEYTETQLDARRRANMNWYQGIFDDIETAFDDWKEGVIADVNNALIIAGSVLAVVLYWELIGKYQAQARVYKSVLRTTVKELKG